MNLLRIAAFADADNGGNPAGVMIADTLPDDAEMRRIAAEVGYSETAFAMPVDDAWRVRYFSPESEVPFCGHATIALGAGFLVVKAAEYAFKISHGYYPGSELALASPGLSIFLSYYYALTMLHALHIVAGLVWNGVALYASASAPMPAVARRAEYAGLYWHFVDVVWIVLFTIIYLIR